MYMVVRHVDTYMCVDFVSDRLATCLRATKDAGTINHKYASCPTVKFSFFSHFISTKKERVR